MVQEEEDEVWVMLFLLSGEHTWLCVCEGRGSSCCDQGEQGECELHGGL